MKLLQELATINSLKEDATKDELMNTICHLAQSARLSGKSYADVVKTIAKKFRALDKHSSSEMSDEALLDMIMAYYNEDQHLAQDNAVTNNRDVSYNYTPVRESVEDDQAEFINKFEKLLAKAKEKNVPAKEVRDFTKMFQQANEKFKEAYYASDEETNEDSEAIETAVETLKHVYHEFRSVVMNHRVVKEEEYHDRKAEAIGMGTKWFKDNFKKFKLPLHVKRIPSSGNYIMASKVSGDEKSKWVFIKWIEGDGEEGTIRQTSATEWKAVTEAFEADQAPGSLDNQQQGAAPTVDPAQGPQGAEKEEPETPRLLSKAGDFRVQLLKNEQVQIIDGKGSIRLAMPLVIWKELIRQ